METINITSSQMIYLCNGSKEQDYKEVLNRLHSISGITESHISNIKTVENLNTVVKAMGNHIIFYNEKRMFIFIGLTACPISALKSPTTFLIILKAALTSAFTL